MATEKEIRFLWKQHGGSQHGPRVETYTIPETGFWKFIAALTSTPATSQDVAAIVSAVAGRFASFGGGKTNEFNPLSVMLSERPALFAMGVDVEDVVRFVLEAAALSSGWRLMESAPRDGPLTEADYDEAITALQNAKRALTEGDSGGCMVCEDGGHSAYHCHHNPLLLARNWARATRIWQCYHCGFIATNDAEAKEHFGCSDANEPACLQARVSTLEAENAELRRALTMPDADRRHWFLCDLIARVGHFNRADLCTAFGISVPQASHDIKRFLSEFPHVATYNKSAKRYERKDLP